MRVVDTRDFCIPSDENDYDELVAFADTMANIPQFDAVPIEMLDKIKAEIYEEFMTIDGGVHDESAKKCLQIIDKHMEGDANGI